MNGKQNEGTKPRLDLIPPPAMLAMAVALTHGADKHGERNWEAGLSFGSHYGAMLRHANAFWKGERFDEDGFHHLGAVMANAAILLELDLRHEGTEHDDRPAPIAERCPIPPQPKTEYPPRPADQ